MGRAAGKVCIAEQICRMEHRGYMEIDVVATRCKYRCILQSNRCEVAMSKPNTFATAGRPPCIEEQGIIIITYNSRYNIRSAQHFCFILASGDIRWRIYTEAAFFPGSQFCAVE